MHMTEATGGEVIGYGRRWHAQFNARHPWACPNDPSKPTTHEGFVVAAVLPDVKIVNWRTGLDPWDKPKDDDHLGRLFRAS